MLNPDGMQQQGEQIGIRIENARSDSTFERTRLNQPQMVDGFDEGDWVIVPSAPDLRSVNDHQQFRTQLNMLPLAALAGYEQRLQLICLKSSFGVFEMQRAGYWN